LNPGDILVSSANSWNLVGKGCWVPELKYPASAGGFISILRGNQDIVDLRYLYHWFVSPQTQAKLRSYSNKTTNISNLDHSRTLATEIPFPPLVEQRRIAAILDKTANFKKLFHKADHLAAEARVSRLRDLLRNGMPAHFKCQDMPLSELISSKPNNGVFRKNHDYLSSGSAGLPVVWVEQLFRGEVLDLSECKKLEATKSEIEKHGLMQGDILFCRSSLKLEGIAKSNLYTGPDGHALFECHLIRISPDRAKVNPIFLNECLNLPEVRAEARRLSKTSTMTTIDQSGILAISVPLPPLHIQEQFAREFALFQRLSAQRRKANRVIALAAASLASSQFGTN
jgi:type I restriction enzyme S subunit